MTQQQDDAALVAKLNNLQLVADPVSTGREAAARITEHSARNAELEREREAVETAIGGFTSMTGGDLAGAIDLISIRCGAAEADRDRLAKELDEAVKVIEACSTSNLSDMSTPHPDKARDAARAFIERIKGGGNVG